MNGLVFIIFLVIIIINVFRKMNESDSSSKRRDSFDRYIEHDRRDGRHHGNYMPYERSRWYGGSFESGTDNRGDHKGSMQGVTGGQTGKGASGVAGEEIRPGVRRGVGGQKGHDLHEHDNRRGNGSAADGIDEQISLSVSEVAAGSGIGAITDKAEKQSGPAGKDGATVQTSSDQLSGWVDTQYEVFAPDDLEYINSDMLSYHGEISVAAGSDFMKGIGEAGSESDNDPDGGESFIKDYFISDLDAFAFSDVTIDARVNVDAVMAPADPVDNIMKQAGEN